MLYDYQGKKIGVYKALVGNGVADDTAALQTIVNSQQLVRLPEGMTIRLTRTVTIDVSKCHMFDGSNCKFLLDGDFVGFAITGSMTSGSAAPIDLTTQIRDVESGFRFINCRIYGNISTMTFSDKGNTIPTGCKGTGIRVRGTVKTGIEGCYITKVHTAIEVSGYNRDMNIYGCNIYMCEVYGIVFTEGSDLHQINITGNHISYTACLMKFTKMISLNNVQITGNDLELDTYPHTGTVPATTDYPHGGMGDYRAIVIEESSSSFMAQFEIVGNTIQAHDYPDGKDGDPDNNGVDYLIEIIGNSTATGHHNENICIVGNHMSNVWGDMIKMTRVWDVTIAANTITNIYGYAYNLTNCSHIAISGENMGKVGGVITASSCGSVMISGCVAQTNRANPISGSGITVRSTLLNGSEYGA